MASASLLLGQEETLTLEFKREANSRMVAREVVAMLNAEGGDLWIGVDEKDGRAAAIVPVPNASSVCRSYRDALVDLVEPSPTLAKEVNIEPVGEQIHISVKPGATPPYALLEKNARLFVVRTGARIRHMTREELASKFKSRRAQASDENAVGIARELLAQELAEPFHGMALVIVPATPMQLRLSVDLEALLTDPSKSGNRPLGWTFASKFNRWRPQRDGARFEGDHPHMPRLVLGNNGSITFRVAIERLHWRGADDELWPYALMEYPTSVFRLLRMLYAERSEAPASEFICTLGLSGAQGKKLRPHSPESIGYMVGDPGINADPDPLPVGPIAISLEDIRNHPDRCAYQLWARIYSAFGLWDDKIPAEYHKDTGQLVLGG